MGWAERRNPNSYWNRSRNSDIPFKAGTPAPVRQDEPMVIELTLKNIWGILCRRFRPNQSRSPAPGPTS